ncbi:telomerase-binding protein EST1A isoform X2 [Sitodiplosis mosellana]|uniref:telomerase-binding protein EST1A isoform X2 n=1 Tax=Sitodiplosis mosellana TaxID=263140 RepID=UPI002444C188|nr:telomerase-binding protein EST1A isoform X2 [Sitodiplosis mosellana]
MESPKIVSMARGADATSAMVDQLSNAIEQMQFRQNYTKLTVVKPNWYAVAHCSGRQKVLIEKLRGADERLQSIIAAGKLHTNWNQYNAVRKGIKEIFAELLRHEMKFCRQNNVEQHFWKLLYHNLIESARRLASDKSNNDRSMRDSYRQLCLHLIADGKELFQEILRLLTQTYGFQLEQYMGVESGKNLKGLKYISLAVVSVQKCCICLGDLLRYQALVNESSKFEGASEWYSKAYQLIPSNGMPSNQLAILALYNKKKFDAIFYHMRSLNASNPIKSAKESLVILFDELRKKYQSLNKVQSQSMAGQSGDASAKRVKMKNFKREIWVHPTDGQLNYRTVFLDQESESLDSVDLYKKFIFNFSHLHGILFTKVGSDSLEICIEQTLKQFQELLNHSTLTSCIFTLQKIAQMIILNIYSIENSMQLSSSSHSPTLTPSSPSPSSSSSQPQSALVFSFAFIGIILNKLQCEMDDMLATTDTDDTTYESKCRINGETHFNVRQINKFKLSDSINNLLAAISLWCNWLKFNWSAWTSDAILVAVHKFNEAYGIRVWDDFACLTMALDKFNFEIDDQLLVRSEPLLQLNNIESYKRIRLSEDMITLGMPSVIRNDFVYCKADIDERCAATVLRWKNIYDFCTTELMKEGCSFLCRLDFGEVVVAQLFSAVDECGSHNNSSFGLSEDEKDTAENPGNESRNTKPLADTEASEGSGGGGDGSGGDKHLISNQETDEHQSNASCDEIRRLLQRKSELEQTHKMQEKLSKFNQDILRQTNSETICLEIRPKYLLPDTNCFIDFLPAIKQLAQVYPLYHVIVPIVVLNELEGLAKGDESGLKIYDTPTKTSLNAHKALVFLKATGSNVKCATSKGSFLNSMAFTKESDCINATESPIDHLNNDDKILMTAINLTKQHSNDAIIGSKPISISNLQRKVVLLTNDRNLKLKAITQNIPVRELVDFIKWSGITK